MTKSIVPVIAATALLVPGCSNREAGGIGARRSVLNAFASCAELESYLENAALDQLDGSYYYGGWGFDRGGGMEGDGEAPPPGSPQNGGDDMSSGGGGLTPTNVQELGVDEADFVKSDDNFIYVLHGQKLVILDAFPAEETRVVSETEVPGWPWQMFVSGKLALVLGDAPYDDSAGWEDWMPRVQATILDLGSDRAAPRIVRESRIDGGLVGARMVGRSARVVTAHYTPIQFDWNVDPGIPVPQPPDCGWEDSEPPMAGDVEARRAGWGTTECDAAWERYYQALEKYQEAYAAAVREHNRARIEAMTLDDFLPHVETTTLAGTTTDVVSECTSFYRTSVESGYGLVSVNTIDLDSPDDVLDATTVVGNYGVIYSSTDQLYLAMGQYPDWNNGWPTGQVLQSTAIHQFDISLPRSVSYIASGEVAGRLNNSFSMDEHDGYLRIATTVDRATSEWNTVRDNTFSILAPSEGLLEVVGHIDGIAPDEQIYSARLFDDRGYLVTFRVIDPLFAIDLRDPTNPVILGELEIPGFSQYMHPLGPDHLLTIGVAANEQGVTEGLKLSIFDVSDPTQPALSYNQPLGAGYSEAQYDHKAFTFKPTNKAGSEGVLAIPMSTWDEWGGGGAVLLVYDVSATNGFSSMGTVDHTDLFAGEELYCGYRDVRRSVMSDDHVYSISFGGFKVNPLAELAVTTASGTFGETDLCGYDSVGVRGGGGVAEDF